MIFVELVPIFPFGQFKFRGLQLSFKLKPYLSHRSSHQGVSIGLTTFTVDECDASLFLNICTCILVHVVHVNGPVYFYPCFFFLSFFLFLFCHIIHTLNSSNGTRLALLSLSMHHPLYIQRHCKKMPSIQTAKCKIIKIAIPLMVASILFDGATTLKTLSFKNTKKSQNFKRKNKSGN